MMRFLPFFLGSRDTRDRATRIGVARIVVGASTFQPAGLSRRLTGMSEAELSGATQFFARAFGIRNIVLGAWILTTLDQPKQYRRMVYQVNAAIDAADMAVLGLAAVTRRVPKRLFALAGVLGTSACLSFVQLASEL